jgi:hypothetical protein
MTDPDNLEGPPLTREQLAENFRELQRVAPTAADKFRLMFGQLPLNHDQDPSRHRHPRGDQASRP